MRIRGADQAIGHLIKWSEKDEWAPYRRHVFAEHFELIMERFDISEQEIVGRVPPNGVGAVGK